jgi:hypothetical protein
MKHGIYLTSKDQVERFENDWFDGQQIDLITTTYTAGMFDAVGITWEPGAGAQNTKQSLQETFGGTDRRMVIAYEFAGDSRGDYAAPARGDYNDRYRSFAKELVSLGMGDTIITPNHEFNLSWSSKYPDDPQNYADGYARLVSVMQSVDGADFTFCYAPARNRQGIAPEAWPVDSQYWPDDEPAPGRGRAISVTKLSEAAFGPIEGIVDFVFDGDAETIDFEDLPEAIDRDEFPDAIEVEKLPTAVETGNAIDAIDLTELHEAIDLRKLWKAVDIPALRKEHEELAAEIEAFLESDDEDVTAAVERLSDLIAERVNAREVTVTDAFDELVETAEPQMGAIGPAFGGDAQKVMEAVQGATRATVAGGEVPVDGEPVDLDDEMVEYVAEPPEHVSGADFDGGAVYVDTSLTPQIESEGYARDVIRRIQAMRKELDLDVEARIRVGVAVDDDRIAAFVDDHADLIAGEVRADAWLDDPSDAADADGGLVEEWEVEDAAVTIGIEPVA